MLPIYHVDAFAERVFTGNPAAVCPLSSWLPDAVMQAMAAEHQLSETAFFVPTEQGFHIRWFTPRTEVDLCGHATLAAAHVLWHELGYEHAEICFFSASGVLKVQKDGTWLVLDFPAQVPIARPLPAWAASLFATPPLAYLEAEDALCVLEHEDDVRAFCMAEDAMQGVGLRGLVVTAEGQDCDMVSRFFAPNIGISEDAVTGSSHTQLVPYWADILGKHQLHARQLSERGGVLRCSLHGSRVWIAGQAVTYMSGTVALRA